MMFDDQISVTVSGDCGIVHPSFADWQNCAVCESILRRRMAFGTVFYRTRPSGQIEYIPAEDVLVCK